jgi:hypothetical protein
LQYAKQEKKPKVERDTAQEGTDCEKYDTGQEEPFSSKPCDELSIYGQNNYIRD